MGVNSVHGFHGATGAQDQVFYLLAEEELEPNTNPDFMNRVSRSMLFGPYGYREIREQPVRKAILVYLRDVEGANMDKVTVRMKIMASDATMAKVKLMTSDLTPPPPPENWDDPHTSRRHSDER